MDEFFVYVKYNGKWEEGNIYKSDNVMVIFLSSSMTFASLMQTLYEELEISQSTHTICVKYETEGGLAPINICNDRTLKVYLKLKKHEPEKTKFTLCLEICEVHRADPTVDGLGPLNNVALTIESAGVGSNRNGVDGSTTKENDEDALICCCPTEDVETNGDVVRGSYMLPCPSSPSNSPTLYLCPPVDGNPIDPPLASKRRSRTRSSSSKRSASSKRPSSSSNNNDSNSDTYSDYCGVYDIRSPVTVKRLCLYASKAALQRHLQMFAILNHFQFKARTSKPNVLHVVCVDDGCKWAVRAIRLRKTQIFQIMRFDVEHTCSTDVRQGEHRQATSKLIGDCVKHKFVDVGTSECRPNDIIQYMQQEYGVSLSYKKALRSKERALESLYGTDDESYSFLPTLSYMLKSKNPGSIVDIVTDDEDRFLYYFLSFGAFKTGWPYCRPVIVVDATFLKSYYRGTLFTACGMDANEQIFPLAFGVGDAECNESWEFFFVKLKECIGDREELVIISDRHTAISNAVRKVYPNAEHGLCMHHLLGNIKQKFKRVAKEVSWKFIGAAKAYTESEWETYMGMLDEEHRGIRAYLEKDVGHERWSRCFFNGKRYSMMTSNNAESMNAMDKKARGFPISKLIDWLRERMQDWFYERREKAASTFTLLSREANKRLDLSHSASTGLTVRPCDVYIFEIKDKDGEKWIVDLQEKSCSCREMQIDQFICSHGIAACRLRGFSVYDYISNYYKTENWKATYAAVIYPIGSVSTWAIPPEVKQRIVKPPYTDKRPAGRPRKKRILSQGEELRRPKCTRCGHAGHNKQTCRSNVPLSQRRKQQKK